MKLKIRFVVATRFDESDFFKKSETGLSLKMLNFNDFEIDIYTNNTNGLPIVYNKSIKKSKSDPAILIFIHDDVKILDFWLLDRIKEGLEKFDIIGVAGNRRRLPRQPTWFCADGLTFDGRPTFDKEFISGTIALGDEISEKTVNHYGPSGAMVKLLDGVFICANSVTLNNNGLLFDEIFDFHFYDLDFCRQAEIKGLTMGTWPISLLHNSAGTADGHWRNMAIKYYEKWVE